MTILTPLGHLHLPCELVELSVIGLDTRDVLFLFVVDSARFGRESVLYVLDVSLLPGGLVSLDENRARVRFLIGARLVLSRGFGP